MGDRRSGILLSITSLPSLHGIGDMGPWAYRFADFLVDAKQAYWQVLPLSPPVLMQSPSPYSCISAFAGNPMLISPDLMVGDGLLKDRDIEQRPDFPSSRVDYRAVTKYKERIFNLAYERFKAMTDKGAYENFCSANSWWLDDFALFVALRKFHHNRCWVEWPADIRTRSSAALSATRKKFSQDIEKQKFLQHVFFKQWFNLKEYCNNKGIQIIGDMPIYLSLDSSDVWSNPGMFKLGDDLRPYVVSGVPPDRFSANGQLWGNPVYRWDAMRKNGYSWWIRRFEHSLKCFDRLRVDHFKGYVTYWEIPAGKETAAEGRWVNAPYRDFFNKLTRRFNCLPLIAEDLGNITPETRELMQELGIPGIRPILFALGKDISTHRSAPHNIERHSVAYTGTHDTNTIRGWFEKEASPEDRKYLFRYIGRKVPADRLSWELIRLAMVSAAEIVIIPMQDVLGLGESARMNRPGSARGNWRWRLREDQLARGISTRLLEMTELFGRA